MFVSPLGTIMNADALKGSQLSTELGIFSVKIHTVIGGGCASHLVLLQLLKPAVAAQKEP